MMQCVWSPDIDAILSKGQSLERLGVRNWALEQEAALVAIQELSARGVAIAGGDVYLMSDSKSELSYDNWFCERSSGESDADYVFRSSETAKIYISSYQNKNASGKAFFAIVPLCEAPLT